MRSLGLVIVIGLAVSAGAATQAQAGGASSAHFGAAGVQATPLPTRGDRYRSDLIRLRTEYLCKRPPKAGALTAAEKARFQARLEALNRRYRIHG